MADRKVYGLLILTMILWGGNPVAVKTVLGELSPILIVLVRFLAMSAILLAVLLFREGRAALPKRRNIPALIAMGLTGITLNNGLQFTGLQYSSAINCTLVSALNPALTAFLAALVLREGMGLRQWLGIVLSFWGVLFLVTHGSIEVIRTMSFNAGDLLFFGSQICWALYSIFGRSVLEDISPMATTAWAGLIGAGFMGVYAWYGNYALPTSYSWTGWLSMAYMVFGSGILAFNWWNTGVAAVGPNRTAIFANLIPLAGMVLAVLILHEQVGWEELFGGVWILVGVYLATSAGEKAAKVADVQAA